MSYLVLARKHRPQSFAAVVGQDRVVRVLINAITRGRVAHAYLFTGPRGVGKTSIARIFARCLNCAYGPTPTPCGECGLCREITLGTSLAVAEIDGASHNSVDNVRDIIDSTRTVAAGGARYKIFIIDEVHMLSTSAFNALLKSIEEPPPHTIFLLATTDPHKIPDTILSRVQRHDLKAVPTAMLAEYLRGVALQEGVTISEAASELLAEHADGSLRDGASLLEQAIAYSDGDINEKVVTEALGLTGAFLIDKLFQAAINRDESATLRALDECFSRSPEATLLLNEVLTRWRQLVRAKLKAEILTNSEYSPLAPLTSTEIDAISAILLRDSDNATRSNYPRLAVEVMFLRICHRFKDDDVDRLLGAVDRLVQAAPSARGGKSVDAGPTPPPGKSCTGESAAKTSKGALNWADFLAHNSLTKHPFLSEQLRRVMCVEFKPGFLRVEGPSFIIGYLDKEETKKKLSSALAGYTSLDSWQIVTGTVESEGTSLAAPGSVAAADSARVAALRKERLDELSAHPTIRSVKRVFPSSVIEFNKQDRNRQ